MKLIQSLLLPVLVGAVSAASDATVYILEGKSSAKSTNAPVLSPEQARLVFAQRLGTSQYHGLGDASETTISYINQFGGRHESLFHDVAQDKAAELVMIVEGASTKATGSFIKAWSGYKPAFRITSPPSFNANSKLVSDLRHQLGVHEEKCVAEDLESAVNPLDSTCWNGKAKVIHLDMESQKMEDFVAVQRKLVRYAENKDMNVMIVFMPESSKSSKSINNPYGSYEQVVHSHMVKARREPSEAPLSEPAPINTSPLYVSKQQVGSSATKNKSKLIRGVLPACFDSRDTCISMTNSCSGRGECYKKYSNTGSKGGCYTCGCRATNVTFAHDGKNWTTTTSWGGSACHKEDVSAPFWLIVIFTVVGVSVVSWGIGMLYNIGEEELPGVIGAGVSNNKATK